MGRVYSNPSPVTLTTQTLTHSQCWQGGVRLGSVVLYLGFDLRVLNFAYKKCVEQQSMSLYGVEDAPVQGIPMTRAPVAASSTWRPSPRPTKTGLGLLWVRVTGLGLLYTRPTTLRLVKIHT